jgi:hypothetical protein
MSLRDVGPSTAPDCRRSCADQTVLVRKPHIVFQFIVAALALLVSFTAEGQTKTASLTAKPNPTLTRQAAGLAIPRLNAAPKILQAWSPPPLWPGKC